MTVLSTLAFSQDITTTNLVWNIDQATDLQTNNTISYDAEIKTNGRTSIEWIQKKGEKKTTYEVTAVEGSWNNVSLVGSITYKLRRNEIATSITFSKTGNDLVIIFDFTQPGGTPARHRFHVESIQPSN